MTANDPADRYEPNPRTRATRNPQRVAYDKRAVHGVLDAGFICHVGFVADSLPVVLPHLYARCGDVLYLHGSTGARALRQSETSGIELCVTVTHVDGIVFARSAFHHSINYRSVVAHGVAELVTGEAEKIDALNALVNAASPHRAGQTRPPSKRELAATGVLALRLEEVSLKTRTGPPNDDPEDVASGYWAGVLPLRTVPDPPLPAPGASSPVPPGLAARWSGRPSR